MVNRSAEIRSKRTDLSPFLFHYTTDFETLNLIVQDMKLKGKMSRICFTEAPLIHSKELFGYFMGFQPTPNKPYLKPMYAPYGIGILRDYLFENGARPLIYGTPSELALIPEELKWRCLTLNMVDEDYSWLREWRINSGVFDFSAYRDEIIIITQTNDESKVICGSDYFDIDFCYEPEIGTCIPNIIDTTIRRFRGIALEEISKSVFESDNEIAGYTNKQNIGEIIE